MSKLRMLFVSGREREYIRNRVLISALEPSVDLTVFSPGAKTTLGRIAQSVAHLLSHQAQYDVYLAGFYGQPIAIALSALRRGPIILDAYVSTFDTLCEDRRWFRPRSLIGRLFHWIDSQSCRAAACILTDTRAHAHYFAETFGFPPDRFETVYVGCDEQVFYPRGQVPTTQDRIEVFYYGSFLPLHGTEVIIQAAHLLKDYPKIYFTIGGKGPRYAAVRQMIEQLDLDNVHLVEWIPFNQIPDYISRASICLGGHFSAIPKAARVISTKTFQFLAMQKATIVGDNPATKEHLVHREHVYAVAMDNPVALAEAISILADNPSLRDRIADSGHHIFRQRFSVRSVSAQLASIVDRVASMGPRTAE